MTETAVSEIRFKIDGKVYDTASVDQISLKDILQFNKQAPEALGIDWNDVQRISSEVAKLAEEGETEAHPQALVMFAVTVWAARRIAGEDITLDEAIDVPMASIEILEARKVPKDHQPKKGKPPKGSGLAAVPATDEATSTTPQTSSERSATA